MDRETWLVAHALSQLAHEHREVITRACYRGETVAELADALGLPQDAVKSRLHHGLHALERALRESGVTADAAPPPAHSTRNLAPRSHRLTARPADAAPHEAAPPAHDDTPC